MSTYTKFTQKSEGYLRLRKGVISDGKAYSVSIFIKGIVGSLRVRGTTNGGYTDNSAQIYIDNSVSISGDIKIEVVPFRNGWRRICAYDPDALESVAIEVDDNEVWYACGGQVEDLPFSSSYIPTNGTPITRSVDKLYIGSENNPSDNEYTLARIFHKAAVAPSQTTQF